MRDLLERRSDRESLPSQALGDSDGQSEYLTPQDNLAVSEVAIEERDNEIHRLELQLQHVEGSLEASEYRNEHKDLELLKLKHKLRNANIEILQRENDIVQLKWKDGWKDELSELKLEAFEHKVERQARNIHRLRVRLMGRNVVFRHRMAK